MFVQGSRRVGGNPGKTGQPTAEGGTLANPDSRRRGGDPGKTGQPTAGRDPDKPGHHGRGGPWQTQAADGRWEDLRPGRPALQLVASLAAAVAEKMHCIFNFAAVHFLFVQLPKNALHFFVSRRLEKCTAFSLEGVQ